MKKEDLETGDLVGVAGIESDWGAAIIASSKRNSEAIYDHIGMIERGEDGIFVWNANPHDGVIRERLSVFITRESSQIEKIFGIYRYSKLIDYVAVIARMQTLLGLPYNFSFIQSDEKYYCSDFIARSFPREIFPLEAMHFEGDFWESYFAEQGFAEIPEGKPGINPSDMLANSNLDYLGNLEK